jgi:hypothetical protein
MNQKRKPYRNKKILAAARGEACLVNLPGCTGGGSDTVAAHSNQYDDGKGGSQKADDCQVAYACLHCHDTLDGRKPLSMIGSSLGDLSTLEKRTQINYYHDRGIKRTIRRLLDLGVLK